MPIKLPKGFQRRKSSGNALDELPNPPEPSFRVFDCPEAARSFDGGHTFKRVSHERPLSAGHFGAENLCIDDRPIPGPHNRMFDDIGKRQSKLDEDPGKLDIVKTESPSHERMDDPYSRINVDRPRQKQASSSSWASGDLQDGQMANKTQQAADALNYYNKASSARVGQGPSISTTMPLPGSTSPSRPNIQQRPSSLARGGLQRSSVYVLKRDSDGLQDADARLLMDSLNASHGLNRQSGASGVSKDSDDEADNPAASLIPESTYSSPYGPSSPQKMPQHDSREQSPTPLFDSSDQDFSATPWRQGSTDTTPRAKKSNLAQQPERSLFDMSPPPPGKSVPPPPRPPPAPQQQPENRNKVMTPAQFERYRKDQEARRDQYFHKDDDSDEEGDDYEDDDEMERNKQLARERRKQEAHLSVYRQQMMKVTGEQPADLSRPGLDRGTLSTPNLNQSITPTFSFDKPTAKGRASDDEDEDVPLGVLAAHGFPSKSRPPTASNSHIQYKSESYPPPSASVAGTSTAGTGRGGLPPFARHLPPDPYYGAGLVNNSNRESLAFGHGGSPSAYGGSGSGQGGTHPSRQSGGLVGVIAGEERARAARRGSPNAQGSYGPPLPPSMVQMPFGMPGMPPAMTPGEQATVQMSEQMNQMMQMQMQWMQQMQQMMASGMQGMPPGQQPPFMMPPQQRMMNNAGMLAPPGQQPRPMTIGSPTTPGASAGLRQPQQRAMSMMTPSPDASWPPQGNNRMSKAQSMMSGALPAPDLGYTPSIAPSERSNVGMPSRYRPVSIAPSDEHMPRASSRSSTFATGMLQTGDSGRNSRLSTSGDRQSRFSTRPVSREPLKNATASDDDDEEGWEKMKQKREEKKSTWRLRKRKGEDGGLDLYDY
ncbi:hypothetical protein P7C71_g111, partial [Lecanoromycetidae sp. Uapishka_2]